MVDGEAEAEDTREIKQLLEEKKEHLAAEYGVTIVGVFGSYLWKSSVRLPSAYP